MARSSPCSPADARRTECEGRLEDDDLLALHAIATRVSIRQGLRVSEAEDIAQETLLALISRTGASLVNPTAWVRVVAARLARHRRRELARSVQLDETMPIGPAVHPASDWQSRLDLEWRLERLPPRHRRILLAHHVLGTDLRQIANDLGLTRGSVKVLLWRARSRARIALER